MRNTIHKLTYAYAAALMAAGVVGCGPAVDTGDIVSTVGASGVLTYHGEPLEYYQVMVLPKDSRPAAGVTDAEGRFTLGTNDVGDGAVAGTHPVTVVYVGPPLANPEEQKVPPPKVKIDKKYARPETSGLSVEIPADGAGELKIDLK